MNQQSSSLVRKDEEHLENKHHNKETQDESTDKDVELLMELKEKGILSNKEFEEKKSKLFKEKEVISFNHTIEERSRPLIDKLQELKRTNILSEDEFLIKKKEIIDKTKEEIENERKQAENQKNEIENRLKMISPEILQNLSQVKLYKLEKFLSIITQNQVIVLHENNVKLLELERWDAILSSEHSEKYKLLFKL